MILVSDNENAHISLAYLVGCMEFHIKQNIPYSPERMKEALEFVKQKQEPLTLAEIDLLLQNQVS
jgi:hypothetical protein